MRVTCACVCWKSSVSRRKYEQNSPFPSPELKAIRWILEKRGITAHKVAVLVGGPDWPVAVVCGILRTSYIQNILGTLPAIFLIMPISLAGAFILESGNNPEYR